MDNLQGLCARCHAVKSSREGGRQARKGCRAPVKRYHVPRPTEPHPGLC